jgi:hypothetical protein
MSANKKIVISSLKLRAPDKGSRKFSFMPKHFGHFGKNPDTQKNSGSLEIFILPDSFRHIIKVENQNYCCCPRFQALSCMKESSMLARTSLEALVNMRGYLKTL